MTSCAHCNEPAITDVPENPGRVCVTHAIEYWTAMLATVKDVRAQEALLDGVENAVRNSRAVLAK